MNSKNKIIIEKTKKIHTLLRSVNNLKFKNQIIEVLDYVIKTLQDHLVDKKETIKKVKTTTIQNSSERVYEKIFNEINSLGYPFRKHHKYGKSKNTYTRAYIKSIKQIKRHYKKHRSSIIDIFKLAQKYFKDPRFTYKPEQRIAIYDFFRYTQETIHFMPHITKYTYSWFNEFAKGVNHIESNFMKKLKDKHPLITKRFVSIWEDYIDKKISDYDLNCAIIYTDKLFNFCVKNKITTSTVNIIVKRYLDSSLKIDSVGFFITDYFWNKTLPSLLIENGIYKSKREINFL